VTERDLTRAFANGMGPEAPLAQFVVRAPVVVSPSTTVLDATATMLRKKVRHLVVATAGHPAAVLSLRDAVEVLLETLDPGVWAETMHLAVMTQSELWLG